VKKGFKDEKKVPVRNRFFLTKAKKVMRKRVDNLVSRVYSTDCLIKKIKAKYLKYLLKQIKLKLSDFSLKTKKFDQSGEVRNLNIVHNKHKFLYQTIFDVVKSNKLLDEKLLEKICDENRDIENFLQKKIKDHYQFDFLKSSFFKSWIKDPSKIYQSLRGEVKLKKSVLNMNCRRYPHHSKNIFMKNTDDYEEYKKVLLITSCNFLFYFQNNPMKYGNFAKKKRERCNKCY